MTKAKPCVIENISQLEKEEDFFLQEWHKEKHNYEKIVSFEKKPLLKRIKFFKTFLLSLMALLLLSLWLWAQNLIEQLFNYHPIFGWTALLFLALAICSLLGFTLSEIWLIYRLHNIDHLRHKAIQSYQTNDIAEARFVLQHILKLTKHQKLAQKGHQTFRQLRHDPLNCEEILYLIEKEILAPLDREAINLILCSAKRLSLFTALAPRLFFEIFYILFEAARLTRKIAELYGCRTGSWGNFQILRHVLHHLVVTTGLNLTDNFLEQFIGHNLTARLSTKLSEGFVNGIMLSRLGIAALEVLRPFPFLQQKKPTLRDIATAILKNAQQQTASPSEKAQNVTN